MKIRREAQSSSLSFIDSIACGFGAILLLFILTAKKQIILETEEASQSAEAAETLQAAIEEAEARDQALDRAIEALDPQEDGTATSLADLAAEQERLARAVADQTEAMEALPTPEERTAKPAALDRPSADQNYLTGLRLRGPRAVILLESSGSMLAENAREALNHLQQGSWQSSEKWRRARNALQAVLAAIPKGTEVAIFQMGETTAPISGSPDAPYIDPYDNAALISLLDRLERLEPEGGADLARGFRTVAGLKERPSSVLLIGDGLPTAPDPSARGLSENDRVRLFNQARAGRPNAPFNAILFPFEGDPSAAGLFWQLSGQTSGITLVPDNDWPSL
ncbi:MAG: hypothetical protein ACLFU4_05420 [Opitutales bacterium]